MEQSYRFESGRRSLEVDQLWRTSDGSARGGASYGFEPDGCHQLRIHARRGRMSTGLSIEAVSGRFFIGRDGEQDAIVDNAPPVFLFDCNDPMLDWVNAFFILGLCDGEEELQTVVSVDPAARMLARRPTLFRREGMCVMIERGADPRFDTRLLLDASTCMLLEAESGGYRYYYD